MWLLSKKRVKYPFDNASTVQRGESTEVSSVSVPIGADGDGNLVALDFHKSSHLLIGGMHGMGKTVLMHAMIDYLLAHPPSGNLQLVLANAATNEFTKYQDSPNLYRPIITTQQSLDETLAWLVEEMQRRFDALSDTMQRDIEKYNASFNNSMSRIFLFIDEAAGFNLTNKATEQMLVKLMQISRAVGIYTAITAERPSAKVITGLMKANIPARIAFKTDTGISSSMIIDHKDAKNLDGPDEILYSNSCDRLWGVRLKTIKYQ